MSLTARITKFVLESILSLILPNLSVVGTRNLETICPAITLHFQWVF